jgi:hypothetical protein
MTTMVDRWWRVDIVSLKIRGLMIAEAVHNSPFRSSARTMGH